MYYANAEVSGCSPGWPHTLNPLITGIIGKHCHTQHDIVFSALFYVFI